MTRSHFTRRPTPAPLPAWVGRIESIADQIHPPALARDIQAAMKHVRRQHARLVSVEQLLTRLQPRLTDLVEMRARAAHAADPANGYPYDARAVAGVIATGART